MNGPLESDERRVGRLRAAHPSNLGEGATGAKPADGVPCSNRDLGPSVSTDAPSAAMTHDQRQQLRRLIDQAKRRQLANHKPPAGRNQAARRATYRAYYQRNRARILARRAASRAA